MYTRRSVTVKYLLAAYLGVALYCEWVVYRIQPMFWRDLQCPPDDLTCTKILFIADPQIQGDYAVPPPFSYLFNWDSDRYLKSTFNVVIKHYKPDVLVYLGDLMDEGSISTIPEFHAYVKRLANIFNINYSVMQIWLPGDNDIGGENEPVKQIKLKEFETTFNQPDVLSFRNITFYKVNGITRNYPRIIESDKMNDNFKIVLSHYPITISSVFGQQVNNNINPKIYFCAHDHGSKYVKQSKDLESRTPRPFYAGSEVLNIEFTNDWLYEVYVPTCSYRMGTSKIGYGAAVLENNNQRLRYTVFWSPMRFPYLFMYLGLLIFLIVYFFIYLCSPLICRRRSKTLLSGASSDKLPLLHRV